MDKYLLVVMIFLIVTIPISFMDMSTGEVREQPLIPLFYAAIAGIILIIFYNGYKERKKRQKDRAKRRSKK